MTEPIRLYRFPLSGHSHRAELFLSVLGLPFTKIEVDVRKGEQKQPAFLAKNPLGQIPVIEDGDVTLSDSNAILVYLATRYDEAGTWYPRDAVQAARVQRWFSLAAGPLSNGPGNLRLAALFKHPVDRAAPEAVAKKLFAFVDETVAKSAYLLGETPTVADIAMYTYIAHAPEGGVSLEPYAALRAWIARIEAWSRFVPMTKFQG